MRGVEAVAERPLAAAYRRFAEVPHGAPSPRPRVCIVTAELIGPFKNGGIGTSMTGLAEMLAADGVSVTVLYTGTVWAPHVDLSKWREHYAHKGITLDAVTIEEVATIAGPVRDRGFGIPWLVYRYLAAHPFDVVHFNDCGGEASLVVAAKQLGLGFATSLLVVALHSPSRWVIELNQTLPSSLLLAAFDYAERLAIAGADVLWGPSQYLLDWIVERGFDLPAQTFVQQYVLPGKSESVAVHSPAGTRSRESSVDADAGGRSADAVVPTEIVFFGRLEERKGLRVFCNAVHALRDELAQRGIRVTFLGKNERCQGMPSVEYIRRRAALWTFPHQSLTDYGQPDALAYLQRPGVLAVMPSPFDNSPCTIYEALAAGIPFLAARTGGIPELIADGDRDRVLFDYSTAGLRDALARALDRGVAPAREAVAADRTRTDWLDVHRHWHDFLPPVRPATARIARVSAIIDHHQGDRLDLTLASLRACPAVQRCIVLSRGDEPARTGTTWIDLHAGDADGLDAALDDLDEEIVLLIHSGVAVVAEKFNRMVLALAAARVDGLLPAARMADGHRTTDVPPLGGSAAFGFFEGVTFTGAMLIRRDALLSARAGRILSADSPFLGLADLAVGSGQPIWPYPDAALERQPGKTIVTSSPLSERLAAYAGAPALDRHYIAAIGFAAQHHRPMNQRLELSMMAINMGLAPLVRFGSRGWQWLRRWLR